MDKRRIKRAVRVEAADLVMDMPVPTYISSAADTQRWEVARLEVARMLLGDAQPSHAPMEGQLSLDLPEALT